MRRRTKRNGKQILFALRAARCGVSLIHRAHDGLGHEARDFMNLDMFVFFSLEQVKPELFGTTALRCLEDHGIGCLSFGLPATRSRAEQQ